MTPERYQQIKLLFHRALDREPSQRRAFLDASCDLDTRLRCEVEKLLAGHERADSFIEVPAFQANEKLFVDDQSVSSDGRRIGSYQIIREVGHGGMGAVFLAERADDQYHKQVAIKLVRRGLDTQDIIRRFVGERQILAGLDHPNIARLLDGGTTEDGFPYFVMNYVEGLPLNEYCDRNRLGTAERLRLFREVCSAVHYAHQNLVIHRDLKPGNILVTADGSPRLLDFGIAKVFHPESSAQDLGATVTQLRVMTPEYASPEQVRGETITTATDVYSLGVILYQLLTGHRPYRLKTGRPDEIARAVCDDEPERPSIAVSRVEEVLDSESNRLRTLTPELVSEVRDGHPEKLRRKLEGDLDNIVLMAMRKEPQRRYSSVEQFAEDIRRHLEGLPVIARKDTFGYRAGKFIKRNKSGVAAATLIALILLAGVVGTAWQARRASEHARRAEEQSRIATEQRDKARLEQTKAERINAFLQQMLSYANPSWYAAGKGKRPDFTVLEALDEASTRIDNELNDQPEIKAEIHTTIGDTYRAIERNDLAAPHFEAALRIRRELFGDRHVKVAESLYYLGGIKFLTGDWVTSEQLYREALLIQREMPNEGNNLPYMLLDAGNLLVSKRDTVAAEAHFREALEIFRTRHGEEHVTVAITHEYLGVACQARGDLNAAQTEYQEALRLYEKTSGSMTATTLLRLGYVHQARGEYEEAETLFRQSLDILLQAYGDKNVRQNDARLALTHLSYLKRDFRAAKLEAQKALRIDRLTLAEGDKRFASLWTLMGMILNKTGEAARAESYLREALRLRSNEQRPNTDAVAGIKGALGECLILRKRYDEAEPLLMESYYSLKASQIEQSPELRESRRRLVMLYEKWKRPERAAEFSAQLAQSQ